MNKRKRFSLILILLFLSTAFLAFTMMRPLGIVNSEVPIDSVNSTGISVSASSDQIHELWNQTWGTGNTTTGVGMAMGGNYIYQVGHIYLGTGVGFYAFITKYDAMGNLNWSQLYNSTNYDKFYDVAIDNNGDICVGGYLQNGSDSDVLIVKYNAENTQLWNSSWDSGFQEHDEAYEIVVDAANNIYVAGILYNSSINNNDGLLLKFNPNGEVVWNQTWSGIANDDRWENIAIDGNSLYLVGTTKSIGAGMEDVLLAKYDLDGQLIWNHTWGGDQNDRGYGIAVDGAHNIVITGNTWSSGAGESDAFIAKYSSAGDFFWAEMAGGAFQDYSYDVAVDNRNDIYIAGGTEPHDTGMLVQFEGLIIKFDSMGHQLWNTTWGTLANNVKSNGIVYASDSSLYLSGRYYNETLGQNDAIILKFFVETRPRGGIPGFQLLWVITSLDLLVVVVMMLGNLNLLFNKKSRVYFFFTSILPMKWSREALI
ncbi:MAG: hypothetical protein ACTSQ8_05960 [Candidatus Helarchaeota archaeon]